MSLDTSRDICKNVAVVGELPSLIMDALYLYNDYIDGRSDNDDLITFGEWFFVNSSEYDELYNDEYKGEELYPLSIRNLKNPEIQIFLIDEDYHACSRGDIDGSDWTIFSDKKEYTELFLKDFNIECEIFDIKIVEQSL